MRFWKAGILLVIMLLFSTNGFTQKRNNQWEFFLGGAIPIKPDLIEELFQVGGSIHGQYVMFLSPRFGISLGLAVEGFTMKEEFGVDDALLAVGELGIGLRYYVTPLESNIQMYLFGMGSYNVVKLEVEGESEDDNTTGIAFGGGFEIPAGESFNILLQGLVRVMFVDFLDVYEEGENFSFVGITAGLAF